MPTMVILVLVDTDKVDDVVETWVTNGSCAITILESSGARYLLRFGVRDDLPIFPSLHTLLAHQEVHHRTLFTVLDDDVDVESFLDETENVVGDMSSPNNGMIIALPVIAARGLCRAELRS